MLFRSSPNPHRPLSDMATKSPRTRDSSAAEGSHRSMRRPPPTPAAALSPPFSARLGAVASSNAAASPVEKPCVPLTEWWLARVEGEERKLAVSRFTDKNYTFTSAPIAKRYERLTLEDEDGVVVLISGSMSLQRMGENGFSPQICEKFMVGFPWWWETWDTHMETYPKCFIHPRDDSIQFYLQRLQLGNFLEKLGTPFIENLLKDAKKKPIEEAETFPECSRFEEHTCVNDLQSLEPLSCQSTPVASLGQVSLKRTELITLNQKAVPNEDTSTPAQSDAQSLEKTAGPAGKQRSAQKRLSHTRSRKNRSPIPYAHHAPLTRGRAHSLSILTPESLKMKKTRSGRLVVPTLDPGSERIVYNTDGMISGVSPVFQSPLTGGPARKRKRKAL